MIRWYELDKANNKTDACFMTIHVVIPSSSHGKFQFGERYLNRVYELCNLLQFKRDVSYIYLSLIIMVVLLKCYLLPTQRHLVTFSPPTEIIFSSRGGSFGLNTICSPFSHWFQIIQWKNHHGSWSYCFSHALSQLRKEIFNLNKISLAISHVPAITLFLLVHLVAL